MQGSLAPRCPVAGQDWRLRRQGKVQLLREYKASGLPPVANGANSRGNPPWRPAGQNLGSASPQAGAEFDVQKVRIACGTSGNC